MRLLVILFLLQLICWSGDSQDKSATRWWNPTGSQVPVIEGQAWFEGLEEPYDRLPLRAKDKVREPVWNLSKHASGLLIRFRTNATQIKVRYSVSGNQAMNHMPATGVSGVDLYAIDSDGQWSWSRGNRQFGDTIIYSFQGLKANDRYHELGREYRLYLPLYNHVKWLEVGVDESDFFRPLPVRQEKPLVIYGTSIAHGACASRPGMSWANILGRKLDRPLINLGFSGNGRLEDEVVSLLAEIDPKIFIIDCLPNLTSTELYPDAELERRIRKTVTTLREKRPETPILLVEHAGYTDGPIQPGRQKAYERVNNVQKSTFEKLVGEGINGLYYLSNQMIDLQLDDMVDGTHPNDLGMMHYANAYEQGLRKILKEPIGSSSTTQPITQYREPNNYDWEDRHRAILAMNQSEPPKTVFFANSIIHFWGGLPATKMVREKESWDTYFTPMGVRNFAYGWDRIENVLWRIYHEELDGFKADKVVVMIGTNNLHLNDNQEILEGLQLVIQAIKNRQPDAKLVLMGILPRRDYEQRIIELNQSISQLAQANEAVYRNIGQVLIGTNQQINDELFSDGLHPNENGYKVMREPMLEIFGL